MAENQRLKDENSALQERTSKLTRKIYDLSPQRHVSVIFPSPRQRQRRTLFEGFHHVRYIKFHFPERAIPPRYAAFNNFADVLALEMWMDTSSSSRVLRFRDLRFYYASYKYLRTTHQKNSWQYVVALRAIAEIDGIKFEIPNIEIINVQPRSHAKLLGRENQVNYTPPKKHRCHNDIHTYTVERADDNKTALQTISAQRVIDILGRNKVRIELSNWAVQELDW